MTSNPKVAAAGYSYGRLFAVVEQLEAVSTSQSYWPSLFSTAIRHPHLTQERGKTLYPYWLTRLSLTNPKLAAEFDDAIGRILNRAGRAKPIGGASVEFRNGYNDQMKKPLWWT